MLKKRITATLLVQNGIVVQSRRFAQYLPVGKPIITMEFFDDWGVDEIILLDISATRAGRGPDYNAIKHCVSRCHVPLTVGGGITNVEQIIELIHSGADKISLNQVIHNNMSLISEASVLLGSQCVVASIDAVCVDGKYVVYDYIKRKPLPIRVGEFSKRLQDHGAGEILINSVERDGMYVGFDHDLINEVCANVTVPVVCLGGAGKPQHFIDVLENTDISGVSAANFYHFSEHSITTLKASLINNFNIRHDTHAKYIEHPLDCSGRLLKRCELELQELKFKRIETEII